MSDAVCRIAIAGETDVTRAVLQARKTADAVGFDAARRTLLVTAVSELARNIVKYAGRGEVFLRTLSAGHRQGLEIEVVDEGPGIVDVEAALKDHTSSGGTLGLGLPGVKRMMDEFRIESTPGKGTRVVARKWR